MLRAEVRLYLIHRGSIHIKKMIDMHELTSSRVDIYARAINNRDYVEKIAASYITERKEFYETHRPQFANCSPTLSAPDS